MDAAQSKILAKLQSRVKSNFDELKNVEAEVGGRQLPGGLQDAVGQITDAKIGETQKEGDPYFFLYTSCISPEEHAGIFTGIFYGLVGNQWQSADDQIGRLVGDLKLLGLEDIVAEAEDLPSLLSAAVTHLKEHKPKFVFNTGRKPRNDGSYSLFIQGPAGDEKPAPQKKSSPSKPAASNGSSTEWVPSKGDNVTTTGDYFDDGTDYAGVIQSANKRSKTAQVLFEDGDTIEVPFANLVSAAPFDDSSPEQSPGANAPETSDGIEVDDRVKTINDFFGDGQEYEGTVTNVDADLASATVVFDDDGSEQDVPFAYLSPIS